MVVGLKQKAFLLANIKYSEKVYLFVVWSLFFLTCKLYLLIFDKSGASFLWAVLETSRRRTAPFLFFSLSGSWNKQKKNSTISFLFFERFFFFLLVLLLLEVLFRKETNHFLCFALNSTVAFLWILETSSRRKQQNSRTAEQEKKALLFLKQEKNFFFNLKKIRFLSK